MKKILSTLVLAAMAIFTVAAQDVNTATDLYNNGVTALNAGNNASALDYLQKAYAEAKACGTAGDEVAANCSSVIPSISIRVAKDFIKAGDFAKAIDQLKATEKIAAEHNNADVAAEAKAMIPQTYMQQGNTLLKAKNFAGAVSAYKACLEITPTNGKAYLNMGQALELSGDVAGAEAAYNKAAANGQDKSANKKLATIYLKKASAANKDAKYKDAVSLALKSASFVESANAYYIAGLASQNLGNNADAAKYLEKYLTLSPNAANAADVRKVIENLKK